MDVKIFSKRMTELMPKFVRGLARQESNYLVRGKITLPQFWTLEFLSKENGCCMHKIADFLAITRPAATGLVDRLIAQGLVRRENTPHDRREVKIDIMPKGKAILSVIVLEKRRTLEKIFSQISPRERKQYLVILERVAGIMQKQPQDKG